MKGRILLRQAFLAFAAMSGTPVADAHSWVERLQRLAPNGTMLTPVGYQRGYVSRQNPTFKGDVTDDLWQLPINDPALKLAYGDFEPICSPQQQLATSYTAEFPKLVTSPGDFIALQHQENGHVTLPDTKPTKPSNRGTIYIYGTEHPKANASLHDIHMAWNVNGTGGDGRGRLIATRNYDDGQCYQMNEASNIAVQRMSTFSKVAADPMGADLWCQSDFQLPTDITIGANYTLYWVWDWPTLNASNAMPGDANVDVSTPEIYTSCIDMVIVDPCSDELGDVKSSACSSTKGKSNFASSFVKNQNLGSAGIPQELTGNFAVAVEGAQVDSGSNTGLTMPGNAATGGAATAAGGAVDTPAATTLQTSTIPATSAAAGGQTVTVTVYHGVETVTVAPTGVPNSMTAALATEGPNGQVDVPARPVVTPIARRRSRIESLY
ncbi:unnamed protein product [Discula destructiva]